MKNKTLTTLTALALGLTASSVQASVIAAASGTTTDGIGFTVAGDTDFTSAVGSIKTATNSGNTITFTFTDFVDLTISSAADAAFVFDGVGVNTIFAATEGSWSFNVGSVVTTIAPAISGSTLSVSGEATGGTANGGRVAASDDWGSFVATGVKSVTWTTNDDTNLETFTFDAVASSVPEPSSTALLGLGGLALLARRRRA